MHRALLSTLLSCGAAFAASAQESARVLDQNHPANDRTHPASSHAKKEKRFAPAAAQGRPPATTRHIDSMGRQLDPSGMPAIIRSDLNTFQPSADPRLQKDPKPKPNQ
jgi:hypothetical protein